MKFSFYKYDCFVIFLYLNKNNINLNLSIVKVNYYLKYFENYFSKTCVLLTILKNNYLLHFVRFDILHEI